MKTKFKSKVSNNLIKNAHLFFKGDILSIMNELLQNSRRACANNVNIRFKKSKIENHITMVYKDDGKGADANQMFEYLAESSWEEDVKTKEHPHGIGIFSLSALEHPVTVRSKNWEVIVTKEHFSGEAEYLVYENEEIVTGVELVLDLNLDHCMILKENFIKKFRFYPLNINFENWFSSCLGGAKIVKMPKTTGNYDFLNQDLYCDYKEKIDKIDFSFDGADVTIYVAESFYNHYSVLDSNITSGYNFYGQLIPFTLILPSFRLESVSSDDFNSRCFINFKVCVNIYDGNKISMTLADRSSVRETDYTKSIHKEIEKRILTYAWEKYGNNLILSRDILSRLLKHGVLKSKSDYVCPFDIIIKKIKHLEYNDWSGEFDKLKKCKQKLKINIDNFYDFYVDSFYFNLAFALKCYSPDGSYSLDRVEDSLNLESIKLCTDDVLVFEKYPNITINESDFLGCLDAEEIVYENEHGEEIKSYLPCYEVNKIKKASGKIFAILKDSEGNVIFKTRVPFLIRLNDENVNYGDDVGILFDKEFVDSGKAAEYAEKITVILCSMIKLEDPTDVETTREDELNVIRDNVYEFFNGKKKVVENIVRRKIKEIQYDLNGSGIKNICFNKEGYFDSVEFYEKN